MDNFPQKSQKNPIFFGFFNKALVVFCLFIASLLYTNTASAAFSFLDKFFTNQANAQSSSKNSQTIDLLKPSIEPIGGVASETDIMVASDGALDATVGPVRTSQEPPVDTETSDRIYLYVVHKGDTMKQIAKAFGVSVNTIMWANDLTSQTVKEGDQLVILPVSGVRYQIKDGDTLKSIAKKYKADVSDIARFNGVNEFSKLAVGDELIIPDGEIDTPSPVITNSNKPNPNSRVSNLLKNLYSGPEYPGYYIRPLAGGVKTQGIHGHNGIDLAARTGTPIFASADGIVIVAKTGGWNGGYGNYVVISHSNGTQTLYAHMSKVNTSVGAQVSQGDTIGFVGASGKATGPHVHFEIRGAMNTF